MPCRRAIRLCDEVFEWVAEIRRAEDGAAEVDDVSHHRAPERDESAIWITPGIQEAVIFLPDAEDLPAKRSRRVHNRVEHGVQAWGVPTSGINGDAVDVGTQSGFPLGHRVP